MEEVDTARMLREARAKAAAAAFKEMGPSYLYNALQDQQPLLVLEVRTDESYFAEHVRASVRVDQNAPTEELNAILNDCRRAVVLTQSSRDALLPQMMEVLKVTDIQKHALTKKVFLLTGGFEAFFAHYPYMCLSSEAALPARAFAETRWPSEIMKGVLYLGSAFNLMASTYVQALGIKTVAQVAPPLSTCKGVEYHYSPINKPADLTSALAILEAAPKPVLVVDLNGDKEAAALCSIFFARAKGLSFQASLVYVVSKRPDIAMPGWLSLAVHNFGDELQQDSEMERLKEQMLRSMTG
jgi:hypothetical protein